MVQRCGGNTYEQGESRRGEEMTAGILEYSAVEELGMHEVDVYEICVKYLYWIAYLGMHEVDV
jgi:hypothetical protein